MFKRLYAWLFNKELVYASFGYSHHLRIVRYDTDGRPYVIIYGQPTRVNRTDTVWIRRNKIDP